MIICMKDDKINILQIRKFYMKTELNKLHFEIEIDAPVEKVWEKMLGDIGYRIWTTEFNPAGSWYEKENEGEFVVGEKVKFLGPDPSPDNAGTVGGMLSTVKEMRKNEFISFEHYGYIMKGQEFTDTPEILAWAPSYENYTFDTVSENKTLVKVYIESDPQYTEMFTDLWPKALLSLKKLVEKE